MSIVLHLMQANTWRQLADGEAVTNPSLASEGFIHCTGDHDVLLQVANAFYSSQSGDFVALHVETELLSCNCVWEPPAHIAPDINRGDDARTSADLPPVAPLFPHVYGPIDRRAVIGTEIMLRDDGGRFIGYADDSDAGT